MLMTQPPPPPPSNVVELPDMRTRGMRFEVAPDPDDHRFLLVTMRLPWSEDAPRASVSQRATGRRALEAATIFCRRLFCRDWTGS